MKKIILSIVALIAILWIAMFVSDIRVLINEEEPLTAWYEYAEEKNLNMFGNFDLKTGTYKRKYDHLYPRHWKCTYITARKTILVRLHKDRVDSCPNILFR